jgi:uncharacterized protein (TIGR03437 family)
MAAPVFAQFSQLVSTDDGQELYFASPLILASSVPSPSPMPQPVPSLYRVGPDGVYQVTSNASMPQVSGDGSIVAFTKPNFCTTTSTMPPGTSCGPEGELWGTPPTELGAGSLQLSRNGRWAVLSPPVLPNQSSSATLIDLSTGQKTQIPPLSLGVNFSVASDGTVLVQQTQIGLWKQDQFTPIILSLPIGTAFRILALSDDAGTLIYSGFDFNPGQQGPIRLVARNLSAGTDTVFFVAPDTRTVPQFMSVSRDGRYVLFRATVGQPAGIAYVADISTGKVEAISLPDGELVSDGTLSGLGNAAFLATSTGRVVRVSLVAGAPGLIDPLFPATAYANLQQPLSPGAYVRLTGSMTGSVDDWQGRIVLGDRPVAVLAAKPGEIDIQVPWEQPTGQAQFRLNVPAGSPFQQNQTVLVSPISPTFLPLAPGQSSILGVAIVRSDFSGLLTTQPQPGDIVHVYMTGLGPVHGSPVSGQPVQLDRLFPIVGSLTCRFPPETMNAETLFAGLAPEMIGIYQLSFRMPNDANPTPISGMACTLQQPNASGSFGITRLTAVQP